MERELEIFVEAAEQLENLKSTIAGHAAASARLRTVADALDRIAEEVGRLPSGLAAVLQRAESSERMLIAAAKQVEALRDAVPAIVETLERSDVGRSIGALTESIAQSRDDLKAFGKASAGLEAVVHQFRLSNEAAVLAMAAEAEKGLNSQGATLAAVESVRSEFFDSLQGMTSRLDNLASAVNGTGEGSVQAFTQITATIRASGERQGETLQKFASEITKLSTMDMASLRADFKVLSEVVSRQAAAIEVLSKKRGISF